MTILLTLFIISLAGILFLIIHKMMELQKGRPLLSQEMLEKTDAVIAEKLHKGKKAVTEGSRFAIRQSWLMIKGVWHGVSLRTLHFLHDSTAKLIERVKNNMRGKHIKRDGGSVSFFLKHIGEEKMKQRNRE